MITAIIPTYRNPDYLDLCLKSATENMVNENTEIIVILDGFVQESQHIVKKYDGIQVLSLPDNKGMQYAINLGVMQANNEFVFVINDDNVFPTRWDARLHHELNRAGYNDGFSDPKFVLTVNQVEPSGMGPAGGPVGPGMFNHHFAPEFGRNIDDFDYHEWLGKEVDISKSYAKNNWSTDEGRIFPFIVAKKWFMAIGGMDVFYNSPNICDWDMFLKWELLDFWFPRTKAIHLYHFESVVTKKGVDAKQFGRRHADAFSQYLWKWGAGAWNMPTTNSKLPPDGEFRGFSIGSSQVDGQLDVKKGE